MKFVSQMRAVMARSATLAAGLVLAIFVCALMPSPTAAATPGANLGVRVAVSFELSAGKRIAYTLNSDGKKTASRIVSFETPEAASATRRYRQDGNTYYLLSWGPLA